MIWLGGYLVLSWLVGLAIAWDTRHCEHERAAELAARYPAQWTALLALAVVLTPIWLPLALPWIGYEVVVCVRSMVTNRRIRRVGKQYREAQFKPISFFQLERSYRNGFDRWTREFLGLGFDLLGDFQNKFDPLPVYNRYFTGCGGAVMGSVTALLDDCLPDFASILEDGTLVVTAGVQPCEFKGKLADEDLLRFTLEGKRPLGELLEIHLRAVVAEAAKRETRVLVFRPEQFQEFEIFQQRRFKKWRQRCGERTGAVPDPLVPDGKPLEPSDLCTCAKSPSNVHVISELVGSD